LAGITFRAVTLINKPLTLFSLEEVQWYQLLTSLFASLPPQSERSPSERSLAVAYLNNSTPQESYRTIPNKTFSVFFFKKKECKLMR